MNKDTIYEIIKNTKPQILYISGKTCTGKSTFSNNLHDDLGYEIIELDQVVRNDVVRKIGLADEGSVFVEVYKYNNRRDLIDPFVASVKKQLNATRNKNIPLILEGAVASTDTISEIFVDYPDFMFIYFHIESLDNYTRNLTKRFMLAGKDFKSGLPKQFWTLVDEKEFDEFCNTRVLSQSLKSSIHEYALRSQIDSKKRLSNLKSKFTNIVIVNL